ncbi:MAG: MFS transporter, partial [Promicromonosporaceae bacterium]|nr:MFS transporter [Promicromonosporaceae bacterium]
YRGRAFAFYDVIFNAAFVAAALLAGFVVPDSGWARPLYLVLAVCYLGAATWQFFRAAREPAEEVAVMAPETR